MDFTEILGLIEDKYNKLFYLDVSIQFFENHTDIFPSPKK